MHKTVYKIHPVVLFNILDHYSRRNEGQTRVIGTLLGAKEFEGCVEVTNCFPVPHTELSEDQVAIDIEFHRTMYELHQQVNPKEIMVGWYSTGGDITGSTVLIHDFYGKRVAQPLHLLVDTSLQTATPSSGSNNTGIRMRGFVSQAVTIGDKPVGSQFQNVTVQLAPQYPQYVALDAFLKSTTETSEGAKSKSVYLSNFDKLQMSVHKLTAMLDDVSNYVDRVVKGEVIGDPHTGRVIAKALESIPQAQFQGKTFEQIFNSNQQDLLMVIYLSNLARSQLALAEKLHNAAI